MSTSTQNGAQRGLDRVSLGIAVALFVIAGVVAWDAAHMGGNAAIYSGVGPEVFPYIIAGALALLGAATAFSAVRGGMGDHDSVAWGAVGWIVAGLIGQILLIGYAGFSIATGFLFAMTARGMGRNALYISLPIGIAVSLGVYLIFTKGLQLSLPAGPLERLF